MSDAFLNRLKNDQLTNIDQYRQMQRMPPATSLEKKNLEQADEWKSWQLAPVTAGKDSDHAPALLDPDSDGAKGLYQAMKVFAGK